MRIRRRRRLELGPACSHHRARRKDFGTSEMPVATLFRLATVDLDTYSKDSKAQSLYDNS